MRLLRFQRKLDDEKGAGLLGLSLQVDKGAGLLGVFTGGQIVTSLPVCPVSRRP